MTINDLKKLLRIPADDVSEDKYFSVALPLSIEAIQDYCNQDFTDEDGAFNLPGGIQLAVSKLIEYQMNKPAGVQSYSLARESTTWATGESGLPKEVESLCEPHRVVRFF